MTMVSLMTVFCVPMEHYQNITLLDPLHYLANFRFQLSGWDDDNDEESSEKRDDIVMECPSATWRRYLLSSSESESEYPELSDIQQNKSEKIRNKISKLL